MRKTPTLLALSLALAGCASEAPPARSEAAPAAERAAPPKAGTAEAPRPAPAEPAPAKPAPPPGPATSYEPFELPVYPPPLEREVDLGALSDQELLEVARARLPVLRTWLTHARGVALRGPVQLELGPPSGEPLPQPAGEPALLRALGLETPGALGPAELRPDQVERAVAASYRPETRTILLHPAGLGLMRSETRLAKTFPLDSLLLHELTHALQHQRFPQVQPRRSPRLLPPEGAMSRWLLEGEASYVETLLYCAALEERGFTNGLTKTAFRPADFYPHGHANELWFLNQLAAQQSKRFGDLVHLGGEVGEQARRAVRAQRVLACLLTNTYALYQTMEPYQKGAFLVQRIHAAQGWAGIDRLFARADALTSEEALRPELCGRVRPPTQLRPQPWPAGWTALAQSTLGERNLRTLCETLGGDAHDEACAGWSGDLVQLAQRGEERLLLWRLEWDRERDALEFARALRPLLRARRLPDPADLTPDVLELLAKTGHPERVEPCPEFLLDRAQVRRRGRQVWVAAASGRHRARPFDPWRARKNN